MGQYRQWLHYRDIDRHLQAQREKLTREIAHLQEQVQRFEAVHPDAGNSIFQALLQQRTRQSLGTPIANALQTPMSINSVVGNEVQAGALYGDSTTSSPFPPLPHSQEQPSSEEVNALLDMQGQTDPQLTIPKWLYRAATQSGPLDPQGVQTNRLVQRWLERWGKQQPEQANQEQPQTNGTASSTSDTSVPSFPIPHEDMHS